MHTHTLLTFAVVKLITVSPAHHILRLILCLSGKGLETCVLHFLLLPHHLLSVYDDLSHVLLHPSLLYQTAVDRKAGPQL